MKISKLLMLSLMTFCLISCGGKSGGSNGETTGNQTTDNQTPGSSSENNKPTKVTEEPNVYTIGQGIVANSFDLAMKDSLSSGSSPKKIKKMEKSDGSNQDYVGLFKNVNWILGEAYAVLENLYQRKIDSFDINNTIISLQSYEGMSYHSFLNISVYEEENIILISSDSVKESGIGICAVCYDNKNENALFGFFDLSENSYACEIADKGNYSHLTCDRSNLVNLIETTYSSFASKNIVEKIDSFYQNFNSRTMYELSNDAIDNYYKIDNLHKIFFIKHYYQLVESIYDGDVPHVEMDGKTKETKFQTNPIIGGEYVPELDDWRDTVVGQIEYSYGEAPEGTKKVTEVASCYKTIYLPYTVEEVTCDLSNVEIVFVDTEDDNLVNSIKAKGSENMKVLKHGEFIDHHGLYVELVPQK